MMNKKAIKNADKCPTCGKRLAKVGRNGKFRCSNPECRVIFVRRNEYIESRF